MTSNIDDSIQNLDYDYIINNMPDGFLYIQALFNNTDFLNDFIVLDNNYMLTCQMSLTKEEIVNRKMSNLLEEFGSGNHMLIDNIIDVFENKNNKVLEFFSDIKEKWYSICICYCQNNRLTVTFRDITVFMEERNKLRKLIDFSPDLILVADIDGSITDCNIKVLDIFGMKDKSEILGINASSFIVSEDRDKFIRDIRGVFELGSIVNKRYKFLDKDRKVLFCEVSINLINDSFDNPLCYFGIVKDITTKVIAENTIIESEEKLRSIFSLSPDAIIVTSTDGIIQDCNYEALNVSNCNHRDELVGKSLYNYVLPTEHLKLKKRLSQLIYKGTSKNNEYTITINDDRNIIIEASSSIVYNAKNEIEHIIIICKDISHRKMAENEIKYLSYHDKLTSLYNRAFFEEELSRLDTERQLPISLIIGDLNGLKLTNDILGHNVGDRILKEISLILKNSCRKEDIVARWGGDEFAIILPKTTYELATKICDRINIACAKSISNPLFPSISLGCATKKTYSQNMNQILQDAEDRMYRHKLLDNRSVRSSIITSLEKTLFERNYETEEHAQRMKNLCINLGKSLNLTDTELDELSLLSLLHDIGKIAIPDSILNKPDKLTPIEWEEMKKHSEVGYRIAKSSHQLSHIADFILSHHEKWDGTGYPKGLKGNNIPKLSRILSVIDAYDVMTNVRPYKDAISHEDAILEIKRCTGTQFDPLVSKTFITVMKELKEKKPK